MRKRIQIYLTTIGSLIMPLVLFSFSISSISKVFLDNKQKINLQVSNFSYQKKGKNIGFNHIKFKQNDIYNPHTKKYEYFLNKDGKKYLIKRFMETLIIGPEISSLKYIVIGDEEITKGNLGMYSALAHTIFINPFPFLKVRKYQLWQNQDQRVLQEKRVEAIITTLVHEYGHHFFSVYAASPIGYSQYFSPPLSNVKIIYSKNKKVGVWNKKFYNQFKQLFFSNGVVSKNQYFKYSTLNPSLLNYEKYLQNNQNYRHNIGLGITSKKWEEHFQSITKQLKKYKSKETLYDRFANVGDLFKMANESKTFSHKSIINDDVDFWMGMKIDNHSMPSVYIINYKMLSYFYSIIEQAVRKFLLSTFIPATANKFKHVNKKYLHDYFYSHDYVNYPHETKNHKNYWYRFYSDNVYPSAYEETMSRGTNRSQALIENIISPLIGYDNQSNLSFITYKSSWNMVSSTKAHSPDHSKNHVHDNYQKIKIGGYINSKDYNYIGHINSRGKITKFPIQVKDFKIWYKNQLEGPKVKVNKDNDYYWYAQDFIDVKKIIKQKLFFFHFDNNNIKIKQQALNSIRKNDYGIANSFNISMINDRAFVKNIMNKTGSNSEWLIVADDTTNGVQLKYYAEQEAMEHIWKWKQNNNKSLMSKHINIMACSIASEMV